MEGHEETLARVQALEETLGIEKARADEAERELAEAIAERARLETRLAATPAMTEHDRDALKRDRDMAMGIRIFVAILLGLIFLTVLLVYCSSERR